MPRNAADRGINMKQGVLLAGEPMALFIAQSEGPLECVDGYTAAIAGAEYNVAVGLRRLEHTAGYLTKLGDDPFGRRIVRGMRENGIPVQRQVRQAPHRHSHLRLSLERSQRP